VPKQTPKGDPEPVSRRGRIEAALRGLAPQMPRHEFIAIADHAVDSSGLRTAAPDAAAWLSLVAYVRHRFTDYDSLLAEGYDADSARFFVVGEMNEVLETWGVERRISAED
jgi:hypothetical protein